MGASANIKTGVNMDTVSYPEGHVLLRKLKGPMPIIERGEGIYLFDKSGKRYIDASSGAFVASVGHGQKEVTESIKKQLDVITYVNGNHFASDVCEELAAKLCEKTPPALDRVYFLSSGSEAVEAAIKFARQYFFCKGLNEKYKIITQVPSYHGNTIFALSASGRPQYKKFFSPFVKDTLRIEAPMAYRTSVENYEEQGADYYLGKLEELILEEGPETIACVMLEPVGGSSTGGACPPKGYLKGVELLCKKYSIFCIADEVLCGMGRTGHFYASNNDGFVPDIMVLAKGLNGGYAPLSAMITKTELCNVLARESAGFLHAQTFVNNPLGAAAGLSVVNYMNRHNLVENSKVQGKYLLKKLRAELSKVECVGNITGRGLLTGIEFVKEREGKVPFSRKRLVTETLTKKLFERGIITWGNTSHVNGEEGDIILIAPPLIIDATSIDEIVGNFKEVVSDFEKSR